jgi:phosphate starvation-inducible PhoH-like protein
VRKQQNAKTKEVTRVHNLDVRRIEPKTANQAKVFEAWGKDYNLVLLGVPGSGKTFLAMYLALKDALSTGRTIKIVRSAVPSRDMGFMPGSLAEKAAMYEAPYIGICAQLLGRGDAYELLKKKGHIEFITTSYLRGTTMDDAIIIVEECQNNSSHELATMITRTGENSRLILAGDIKQSDLVKRNDVSGLKDGIEIFKAMQSFAIIEFDVEDIVRSKICKEFVIARLALEDAGKIKPL